MNFYKIVAVLFLFAGTFSFAQKISDNFDWGAGVAGRESVIAGGRISGMKTQIGGKTWRTDGTIKFSGTSGKDGGYLEMTGKNAFVQFDFAPSGKTTAVATGRFTPGDGKTLGFFFGFQSKKSDVNLLFPQKTDKLLVRLKETGDIVLQSLVAGELKNGTGKNSAFKAGEQVTMTLVTDMDAKIATLTATGKTGTFIKNVAWKGNPDWGVFAVNQTGNSKLFLEEIIVE